MNTRRSMLPFGKSSVFPTKETIGEKHANGFRVFVCLMIEKRRRLFSFCSSVNFLLRKTYPPARDCSCFIHFVSASTLTNCRPAFFAERRVFRSRYTNHDSYLERRVVGSFITMTSAMSPNLEKYSLRPSEREEENWV